MLIIHTLRPRYAVLEHHTEVENGGEAYGTGLWDTILKHSIGIIWCAWKLNLEFSSGNISVMQNHIGGTIT